MLGIPLRWFAATLASLTFAAAVAANGCSKSTFRSQEGQLCSTSTSDNPHYLCDPGADLVCIATRTVKVRDPALATKYDAGLRPVWVCRYICSETGGCIQTGDVCCPGPIHGKSYGKTHACVPQEECQALELVDTGAPDLHGGDGGAGSDADPGAGTSAAGPDGG